MGNVKELSRVEEMFNVHLKNLKEYGVKYLWSVLYNGSVGRDDDYNAEWYIIEETDTEYYAVMCEGGRYWTLLAIDSTDADEWVSFKEEGIRL